MKQSAKIIMRRVYYSFTLSILTSSSLWQGILLGASVATFGRLTHVAAIWNNMLAVPLGSLPGYVSQTVTAAITGGELLTVLVTVLILALSISFVRRIRRLQLKPWQVA